MENNNINNEQGEKKPKRPRIGAQPAAEASGATARYDSYRRPADTDGDNAAYRERNTYPRRTPYQPGENNGGYQPRYNNRYNNGDAPNSYPRRNNNYQNQYPRRNYDYQSHAPLADDADSTAEGTPMQHTDNGGYQPRRQQSYPRQNSNYQPRYNNQGNRGYNQGGYNNRGYNQGNNRYNQGNRRPQQGAGGAFPARGKSFIPRPKRIEYEQPLPDPNEEIRLNKYMANAGICSRREADEFIQQGLVKVNGEVVTELGTKITAKDVVEYDDKVVTLESKCYILLNKPKDCVTTSDDPNGRLTVMDLVKGACNERIYPVGRLDRNTTGVLLLTNDGDLASKLTHPKYVKKKIYHVWTDKDISEDDMQRIADGIELEDGPIHADAISYATETDRNQAGIEIHSGRNRIVRRIFESLGYHVVKLDRVYFAGLTKKNLPRGRWRYLTQEEVNYLKMGSFE